MDDASPKKVFGDSSEEDLLHEKLRSIEREIQKIADGQMEAISASIADDLLYLLREAHDKLCLLEIDQQQAAEQQMAILNSLPAHIALLDSKGIILAVNEAWRHFAEANVIQSEEFFVGQDYLGACESAHGDCAEQAHEAAEGIRRVLRNEIPEFGQEYPCHSPTEERWFRLVVTPLIDSELPGAVVMHVNITERKLAEKALQENQVKLEAEAERLKQTQKMANIGSWETNLATFETTWTDQTHQIFEIPSGEFSQSHQAFLERVHPDDRAEVDAAFLRSIAEGVGAGPFDVEHRLVMPDGRVKFVEEHWRIFHDPTGKPLHALGSCQDVTERRQVANSLEESLALLRIGGRIAGLGGWSIELSNNELTWSDETFLIHGLPVGDAPSVEEAIGLYLDKYRDPIAQHVKLCIEEGKPYEFEAELISANKRHIWVRSMGEAVRDEKNQVRKIQGAIQDITEQKQVEIALEEKSKALLMLSRCHESLVHAQSEMELLENICRTAVDVGGYRMAWVGYALNDADKTVKPQAYSGDVEGYLDKLVISWDENEPTGQGPMGRAIRSGEVVVIPDLEADELFAPWIKEARAQGFRSVITLPLKDETRTFGGLLFYSSEVRDPKAPEIQTLNELAENMAYGIINIRGRQARQHLQSALVSVATAVSTSTGKEFFEKMVCNISETLGAESTLVAQLLPGEPLSAKTIAVVVEGELVDNYVYNLDCTPCLNLIASDDDTYIVNESAIQEFPRCDDLKSLNVQSYVGRRLESSDGEILGLMFVLFREPPEDLNLVTSILHIFAARAASELERQQTNAKIHAQAALLDKAKDAIIVKDLNHKVIFWNHGAERLYNISSDDAVGCDLRDLIYKHSDDYDSYTADFEAVMKNGEALSEIKITDANGQFRQIELHWSLMYDDEGNPESVFSINTDVTDRKKVADQQLRVQRMESIGTLAGGIAHDLNNVLTPIIMSIELLKMQEDDDKKIDILNIIENSAKHGAEMVQQVLSFARGVDGKKLQIETKDLIEKIQKVVEDTFLKNIVLRSHVAPDLWAIEGDPTQLHQVLVNICVNARDAMPEGGTLEISVKNLMLDDQYAGMDVDAKPGPYISIELEDSGHGMPSEILDRIFEPFFTTKDIDKGTGLGLSTSMAIIKAHGGFMRVYSEVGSGTRFHVYLPAMIECDIKDNHSKDGALKHGDGELILLVDDEKSVRDVTSQTLVMHGYRVITAADGVEATSIYADRKDEIDLVITDMMMPVMDGATMAQVLLKMNPKLPIIAASGLNANSLVAKAMSNGIKHFMPKPYTAQKILETIREALSA